MKTNVFLRFTLLQVFVCLAVVQPVYADEGVFKRENLKVLNIGNSYTEDATAMLKLIALASGSDISDICIYQAVRGSGSFKTWYNRYYGIDNYERGYKISKVLGDIDANITTGEEKGTDNSLFKGALDNEQWDIIIIHQVSDYAPYYEEWNTTDEGGYLSEFMTLLKEKQPQAAIGFLLVHSYWDDYWRNTEHSSYLRWSLIANSVKRLCEDYDIDFVIPYGTAVENLRASSLNNEYDLTRDGLHCGFGLCRYTAACCYYESVIAPRSGISVLGNSARYDASHEVAEYPSVSITDENAPVAQEAAILAMEDWYSCRNPEDYIAGIGFTMPSSIENRQSINSKWYDLSGRQLSAPPAKGIYIREGKKVVVK